MKNIFDSVLMPKVSTNRFSLNHDVKLSFSMGELVPTCVMECLPGDVVSIEVQNMLRFAPLISPVMHKVNVTTHYFFVPNRILWADWEKWITGDSDVVAPYFQLAADDVVEVGSLADYLGVPTGLYATPLRFSPMSMAAYTRIFDEYYRDQNLQTVLTSAALVPGDNTAEWNGYIADGSVLRRAWMHDYFTSALPFAQKGDAVSIPLTSQDDIPVEWSNINGPGQFVDSSGTAVNGDLIQSGNVISASPDTQSLDYDPQGSLTVDVQAGATDINTLRRAFRLQEWLEKNARGGTRYIESILSHFGVKSSDSRLQRPEYIGGAHQNMVISEVLSTAENTDASIPVGQMAGHGISVGGGNRFTHRCEEHGFIIGIMNVQPTTAYQQGLHRQFTRFDRLDYAWPTFANIGEQEILLKELMANPDTGTLSPNSVFGYIPRYAEYKFMNSRVAGEFRDTLNFWHLGRIFDPLDPPVLNEEFITSNPSTRIFAVTDPEEDHIFAHVFNNISAIRKLPRYGIPQI